MAKKRPLSNKKASDVVGAGITGGGLGTIIATIANNLPDGSRYKTALLIGSPLITVGISGVWLFIKNIYIDPFVARKRDQANNEAMERILQDARLNAQKVLDDSNASVTHRKNAQKMVEELELLRFKKIAERFEITLVD